MAQQSKKSMKLRFLGVRGSWPTHKRGILSYGGNSTAMEIVLEDENFHLFVDGGSGISDRGHELGPDSEKSTFHFLISHTHWDHILGLPMFKPFFGAKNSCHFYAANTAKASFEELFNKQLSATHLPIPPSLMKSNMNFNVIKPEQTFEIEKKIKVSTFQLNHQEVTLGYKIEYGDDSVAVMTDNAPIENGNHLGNEMRDKAKNDPAAFEKQFNDGMTAFLKGVHTVVFDTHFTEKNLRPDFGHSTPNRVLEYCKRAGVSRLILFHHAPEDTDAKLDQKIQDILNEALNAGIEVEAAREGEEWELCA